MRWRKFSISTLLLATAGLALLALPTSWIISNARLSRERSANASLVHDVIESVGGGGKSFVMVHDGPRVYVEYGFNLHSVTDQTIPELRRLNHLHVEHLNLEDQPITDAGLSAIAEFKHLRTLDVSGTDISDSSMSVICKLVSLNKLDVSNTNISDANLQDLQELESLTFLYTGKKRVTENGISELRSNCPSLIIKTNVEMSGWGLEE
ncbi:MAG: hypothetical protein AAF456_12180 [Planctomycetota bacterium]